VEKNYNLKAWFSLEGAARRLSVDLDEEVSVQNVIELVIEGRLAISWRAKQVHGQVVVPFSTLSAQEGWRALTDDRPIAQLDGPYRLELGLCGSVCDWINSSLTETGGELDRKNGLLVSDGDGNIWQIMEYRPGDRYRIKMQWERLDGTYHPSMSFPHQADLVIQRRDIEAFEQALGETTPTQSLKWTPQMRQ
jgi:hypothetical protein